MPMVAFFPWAVQEETLVVGEFTIAPFGAAVLLMPPGHATAVREVVAAYDKTDDDLIARVPILFRTATGPTDDVADEDVGALFLVGEMVACAALASRQFFMHAYWNRDSFHFVVQGFRPDRPGGALITSRRRDGAAPSYVPAKHYRVPRPFHVGQGRMEDLDRPLLDALVEARDDARVAQLHDAVRGFNAANTDSPTISQETELVLLVGAYSRLCDVWDKDGTAAAVRDLLDRAPAWPGSMPGTKWEHAPLKDRMAKSRNPSRVYEWMADAYLLRGQFAHGRGQSPYKGAWGLRDHLLLGTYLFPLAVKAWLGRSGRYTLSPTELMRISAFDALSSCDHFVGDEGGGEGDEHRRPSDFPWVRVIQSIPIQLFVSGLMPPAAHRTE
ncbi:MAG: hypothetical protein K2R93_16065 [Gemmatimonadaceae bacterium]|nr:hypothetical protein [Gemmatimonadaceae bacterium]